jgi:hypothetical protein
MNNVNHNLIPGQLVKLRDINHTRYATVFIHPEGSRFLLEASVLDGGHTLQEREAQDPPIIDLNQGTEVVVENVYFSMNVPANWHMVADGITLKVTPNFQKSTEAAILLEVAKEFFQAPKGTEWVDLRHKLPAHILNLDPPEALVPAGWAALEATSLEAVKAAVDMAKVRGCNEATWTDGDQYATVVRKGRPQDLVEFEEGARRFMVNPDNTPEERVRDAVFLHWFETGEDPLIKEIATRLGWSDGKVRGILDRNGGAVPGTNCTKRETPVRDKNFGGIIRHRLSAALTPAKSYLREVIGNQ